MKINRHNYEEYFILYADNELSSEDRRMVEEFASLNPDLKDELDSFCSTVLMPDISVEFSNKEELLHYDDSLILYIDDELPANEKLELEKLVAETPSLQKELELYRKTKLQPSAIVFENKSVLYRSNERKVVRMTWVRWAAAAVILLAVSVTAITVFNNGKENNNGTAGINNEGIQGKTGATPQNLATNKDVKTNDPSSEQNKNAIDSDIKQTNRDKIAAVKDRQKVTIAKTVSPNQLHLPENKNQVIASNTSDKGSNNLPSPENNPNYKGSTADIKTTVEINQPVYGQKNVNGFTTASLNVTDMRAASYNNTEGRTINPDEEGGDNKKSRGLLRKLTRVFEKNTGIKATTDDDKLHIAAFTVKLK